MKAKKRLVSLAKLVLVLFVLAQFVSLPLYFPKKTGSANLSGVKDTLSTARLSFVGALASGNTEGSSVFSIKTSSLPGWAGSDKNFNLFPGDTVLVGSTNNYTVDDIIDDSNDDQIQLTAGLSAGDADENDPVIATVSAVHTISMTTATAIPNGAIKVRVKATAVDAAADDGIPDKNGFDFGTSAWSGDITCPGDVGSTMDFVTGTATASGDTGCASGYHCFECRYSGAGNASQALSMTIGSTRKLINPAPGASHTYGAFDSTADNYSVYVDHLDSSDAVIDQTHTKVGLTEAVRVTATVEPSISFTITGSASGGTACGATTDVTTTATTVPFGALSLSAFNDAAQNLKVTTNADGGYTVQARENDQLSKGGDHSVEIPDSPGDTSTMTHSTADEFNVTTTNGFGYSLENMHCNTIAFSYDDSTGGCSGTFCAKQFADTANSEAFQTLFNSSTVANAENVNICYRVLPSTTQEGGDYENFVEYLATATF